MSDNRYIFGLFFGGLTYILSFSVTVILTVTESYPDWMEPVENEVVSLFDMVGWIFYSSHLVGVHGTIDERAIFHPTLNLVLDAELGAATILFLGIPILLLVIAGSLITGFFTEPQSPNAAAIDGASLVFAYLPLSLLGALVFSAQTDLGFAQGMIGPDPGWAVLIMGLIYPALFGSIGGNVGYWLTTRD